MNNHELLDIYSDFLLSTFGPVTATGLASVVNGSVSHDQVTRFLGGKLHTAADLWRLVKPYVRQVQRDDAVLIIDDSIAEKPYTDESDLVCWHYDHTSGGTVKGFNFMTVLYHSQGDVPFSHSLLILTKMHLA